MVVLGRFTGILHKYPGGAGYLVRGISFYCGKIKIGFF